MRSTTSFPSFVIEEGPENLDTRIDTCVYSQRSVLAVADDASSGSLLYDRGTRKEVYDIFKRFERV